MNYYRPLGGEIEKVLRLIYDAGWLVKLQAPRPFSMHWLRRGWLDESLVARLLVLPVDIDVRVSLNEAGEPLAVLISHHKKLILLATKRDSQRRGHARLLLEHALDEDGILVQDSMPASPPPLGWVQCAQQLGARFQYVSSKEMRVIFEKGNQPEDPNPFLALVPPEWALREGAPAVLQEIER
jgi:hypothetical protein